MAKRRVIADLKKFDKRKDDVEDRANQKVSIIENGVTLQVTQCACEQKVGRKSPSETEKSSTDTKSPIAAHQQESRKA